MRFAESRLELVAIDDGFDFTKVVSRSGKQICIPTAYAINPSPKVNLMGGRDTDEEILEIEGLRIAVGAHVASSDTRFEDYPYHPANLAVAMHAMRHVIEPNARVHVIAGVPLNRFFLPSGDINSSVPARKTQAWSRLVRSSRGQPLPQIVKVSVTAEAVAAWFDFVIDDKFAPREEVVNDFMAVVDIGGRTTDIAVFQNGSVNLALSGTLDKGILDIQKHVLDAVATRYPGMAIPRALLTHAVQHGALELGTDSIDVSAQVLHSRESLFAEIDQFISAKLGTQMPLMKRILFVGGGASALRTPLLQRYPRATLAEKPQMANARGMLKFGVTVAGFEDEKVA